MKFGQFIDYYKKNIFLEKSYTKCGGETDPELFLKNQKWTHLWIHSPRF